MIMTLKENAIILGIAILLSTFVFVTSDVLIDEPHYQDYCKNDIRAPVLEKDANCTYSIPASEQDCYGQEGIPTYDYDEQGCRIFKECSFCNLQYEDARERYSNTLLFILAPLGALAIILGVYYKIEFIGTGFMFAGIIIMLLSTVQNFDNLNEYVRMIVVFLELMLVLFIAYKKVLPDSNKKKGAGNSA